MGSGAGPVFLKEVGSEDSGGWASLEGEEEEGREDGEDLWVRGGPSQGMDYGSVDPTVASSSSLGARRRLPAWARD